MNNLPYVEVSFIIEGKFDVQKFSEEIGISPSETRGINDWPDVIKKNTSLPKELQPRCVWCISQKAERCNKIEIPINKIIFQLISKEQKIIEFCNKNNLISSLCITIYGEAMNLPEIVLSSKIVSYFGELNSEISFDLC